MCRYGISLIPYKGTFPVLTLCTNLLGAVLIGVITGLASRGRVPPEGSLFWKTGVCGGFTTFSTFSLEGLALFQEERYWAGGLYMVLSVGLCLAGVALGQRMSQALAP